MVQTAKVPVWFPHLLQTGRPLPIVVTAALAVGDIMSLVGGEGFFLELILPSLTCAGVWY